ncbi:MAG: PAS domain-containing protein, partial [Desulfitobacterium sp.]|nr:PAS domain-containing protein [Desulfitobacterium sp.]
MITKLSNILDKVKSNGQDPLEELQKEYNQLKENITYGQKIAKVGSWTYDLQADEIFSTSEVYEILECTPEEYDGSVEGYYSFVHPEDREKVRRVTNESFQGKEYDLEYRIITRKSTEKYVHEKAIVLFDENNQPIKMIGVLHDITEQKIVEKNLRELGDYLKEAQRVAGVGSFKYDALKDELYASPEALKVAGMDPITSKEGINKFLSRIHPEDQPRLGKAIQDCLVGSCYNLKVRIPQEVGKTKYIVNKGDPLFNEEGKIIGIIGTIQDITKFELLQKDLQKEHERLINTERIARMANWEIDLSRKRVYLSEGGYRLLGVKPKTLNNTYEGLLKYVHPEDRHLLEDITEKITQQVYKLEFRIIRTDGSVRTVQALTEKIFDQAGNPSSLRGSLQDITDRVKMANYLEYMANHDELTGLPNSRYFRKKLELLCQSHESKKGCALMMVDIEGFKYINYSLGYEIGEKIVLKVARKLKTFLGKEVFLSRYSDYNFAFILQGRKTRQEYEKLAQGIIDLFRTPFHVKDYDLDLSANIGICICSEEIEDQDSFKKQAKVALLRAKKEGKNTYKFYSADLDIQHYKEVILRNDLHRVVESGQLRVHYQPIVRLKTGEILAVEALARWEHPEWGMVYLDEFIPLAEET